MSSFKPFELPGDTTGDREIPVFLEARRGCPSSRWQVLANCVDYLRFVVRQGSWSSSSGVAKTSDLVHRTIVEAWQKFSHFQGEDERQLRGWIKAILINSARRDRRDSRTIDAGDTIQLDALPGSGQMPDRIALDLERSSRIDAALAHLNDRDQTVIRLRIWDEFAFAEIGTKLGISEDAARMLFARALDRLRRCMRSNNGLG